MPRLQNLTSLVVLAPMLLPAPISLPRAYASEPATPNAAHMLEPQGKDKAAKQADSDDDDKRSKKAPIREQQLLNPTIWHDPGQISSLDLLHGQGSKKNMPEPPFTFLDEDRDQSTPKLNARDANGRKWKVKLGHEARPEVVASRLLWAVGYYANDDYVMPEADIHGIHMHRGKKFIKGEHITDARFARKPGGQKKIGIWKWKDNHYTDSRELNGLRVMMAVLNSWDLKDENNAVFQDSKSGRQIFLVSDVGTSFGRTGLHFTNAPSKDNARAYATSKFIVKTTPTTVDFANPAPSYSLLFETLGAATKQFARRQSMLWIGRKIPRQDARWIGSLLGQLSHQQLVDAFRAGDYPAEDVDLFVKTLEDRIHALNQL